MVEWWMTYAQWQHLEGLLAQLPNYTTTTVLRKEPAAGRKVCMPDNYYYLIKEQ